MGDVFSMPYHVPNMDPTLNMAYNPGLTLLRRTMQGYVFTKRRMFVVLYKHETTMICLPLGTHHDRGMAAIPPERQHEHVCLQDLRPEKDKPFIHMGPNRVVQFNKDSYFSGPLSRNTTIDLSQPVATNWDFDVRYVGRVTRAGHWRLVKYHNYYNCLAQIDAEEHSRWDPRDGPEGSPN